MQEQPDKPDSDSSDPTNPIQADSSPCPPAQGLPSLPGAKDWHRQQAARLDGLLRRVAQDPEDLLAQPDPLDQSEQMEPKERLAQAEKLAQAAMTELQEAQVEMARMEILGLLAKLDLKDLQVLKQLLTTKNWRNSLLNKSTLT